MLFAVRMDADLPRGPDPEADVLAREKAYSRQLQRAGTWLHPRRRP